MIPINDEPITLHAPIGNYLLFAACFLIFIFQWLLPPHDSLSLILEWGWIPSRDLHSFRDKWIDPSFTILTHMFLHGGWMHLLGNMWTLHIFGDNVEDRMGSGRFLVFYVVCGIFAAVFQGFIDIESISPMIGASGAISGIMAAYLFLYPKARILFFIPFIFLPYFVKLPAWIYIIFWFLFQTLQFFSDAGAQSSIAFGAHIGGFVAGLVFFRFFIHSDRTVQRKPWPYK